MKTMTAYSFITDIESLIKHICRNLLILKFRYSFKGIIIWALVITAAVIPLIELCSSGWAAIAVFGCNLYIGDKDGSGLHNLAGLNIGCFNFSEGVRAAVEDPENEGSLFYVYITMLFPSAGELYGYTAEEWAVMADSDIRDRVQKEWKSSCDKQMSKIIERLSASHYNVWRLSGGRYTLAGLLTKEQLLDLPVSDEYGFSIDWVY